MGYSRQAAAIGFELIALPYLCRDQGNRYIFWILVSALFHKSALVMMPLAAFTGGQKPIVRFVWVIFTGALAAYYILGSASEHMWHHYVERQRESTGALVRVAMNVIPALVLLVYGRGLCNNDLERRVYLLIAIGAICAVPAAFLASTAADRISLYLIPIQLLVFGRIGRLKGQFGSVQFAVVFYYALVQFVWLNFASHAFVWIPYKTIL
jgi:hypothetical protein